MNTWSRAAAAWSSAFAVVHVAWAFGWTGGLGPEAGEMNGWFLAYDVVVAGMCVFGAYVAWFEWRIWMTLASGLLALRGGAGVVQALVLAVQGEAVLTETFWVEPFFVLGAFVFGLGAWRARDRRVPAAKSS